MRRCSAIAKTSGRQCQRQAAAGLDVCSLHDPSRAAERSQRNRVAALALWSSRESAVSGIRCDLLDLLQTLITETRKGSVDRERRETIRCCTHAVQVALTVLKTSTTEAEIRDLRNRLERITEALRRGGVAEIVPPWVGDRKPLN